MYAFEGSVLCAIRGKYPHIYGRPDHQRSDVVNIGLKSGVAFLVYQQLDAVERYVPLPILPKMCCQLNTISGNLTKSDLPIPS